MKKIILIGKTNVGKTLFMINFAQYLGLKRIYINQRFSDGRTLKKEMSIKDSISYLSSSSSFKTQCLQSVNIDIPVYKGVKKVTITDTSGVSDGIHPSLAIRKSISQTLENLDGADILIHIIDASVIAEGKKAYISEIDKQIISYGRLREGYVLLANKIDLDNNYIGFKFLKRNFSNINVLPISALHKTGFNEVKKIVIRNI